MNNYKAISIYMILCYAFLIMSNYIIVLFSPAVGIIAWIISGTCLIHALWIIAHIFGNIAKEKEYDEKGMVLFIFLTFIIGYIYVLALPDKSQKVNVSDSSAT